MFMLPEEHILCLDASFGDMSVWNDYKKRKKCTIWGYQKKTKKKNNQNHIFKEKLLLISISWAFLLCSQFKISASHFKDRCLKSVENTAVVACS